MTNDTEAPVSDAAWWCKTHRATAPIGVGPTPLYCWRYVAAQIVEDLPDDRCELVPARIQEDEPSTYLPLTFLPPKLQVPLEDQPLRAHVKVYDQAGNWVAEVDRDIQPNEDGSYTIKMGSVAELHIGEGGRAAEERS